jgi:hypothetical protein
MESDFFVSSVIPILHFIPLFKSLTYAVRPYPSREAHG